MKVSMTVNGAERSGDVEPRVLLVDFLRTNLRLTGTHIGCDTSSCGACTVLIDGEPVKSCTQLAVQADGRAITTVEGLATAAGLSPMPPCMCTVAITHLPPRPRHVTAPWRPPAWPRPRAGSP